MYMMVESKVVDPLEVGGHVLAGYLSIMDLSEEEFDALKMCVAGRFAQVKNFSLKRKKKYCEGSSKRLDP